MKALLIVIFAVYVTTITSRDIVVDEAGDNRKLAELQNYQDDDNLKPLEQCSERTKGAFSFYDYSVVIAMLAVSLKIGVFYGYFHKSSSNSANHSDFMLGSQMGLFPVTLSLATSFVTAIELLGNPSEMFFHGTQFSLIGEIKID